MVVAAHAPAPTPIIDSSAYVMSHQHMAPNPQYNAFRAAQHAASQHPNAYQISPRPPGPYTPPSSTTAPPTTNHPSLSGHANHTNTTPHCSFPSVPPFQQPPQQPPLSGSAGLSSNGNNGAYAPAPTTNHAYHSAPPTPYTNTSNAIAYDVGSMQSGRYAFSKMITRSAVSR